MTNDSAAIFLHVVRYDRRGAGRSTSPREGRGCGVSLLLAVIFLLGNAFFVGAQFALITARADQVEPLAESGARGARAALAQMRGLSRMLAGSQLGIAACSLGLGAVAEPAFAHVLQSAFDAVHVPEGLLHSVSFVIALAFVSYCHMVLGEMVPKNLALAGPVRAALWLGRPMAMWVRATRPILVVTNGLANAVLRVLRVEPKDELGGSYTAADFADLFTASAAEGLLDHEEQRRLHRALRLEHTSAGDLLVPMTQLVTIGPGTTPRQLEQLVARTGHSRFPVSSGDELPGYLHAKDILDLDESAFDEPIPARLWRAMVSLHPADSVSVVFTGLQRAGAHLGRVVESGRAIGVVALEDVLEPLVGGDEPGV